MMRLLSFFRRRDFDGTLFLATVAITAIGAAAVYSAGQTALSRSGDSLAAQHVLRILLGFAALAAVTYIPSRLLDTLAYPFYGLGLLLLLLVELLGNDNQRGDLWISLGPFNLEPSELCKLGLILALARCVSAQRRPPDSLARLVRPFALVLVPVAIVAVQPDLGTALVLAGVCLPMLYWAGLDPVYVVLLVTPAASLIMSHWVIPWTVFLFAVLAILYFAKLGSGETILVMGLNLTLGLAAPLLWGELKAYQQARLLTFLDPGRDPLGAGYQILQSKVALGSGGLWGKGYLAGTQKSLSFLPEQHTDFIFSVVGEEFGFLGAILLLALYFVLISRILLIASHARNRFAGLIAVGVGSSILAQLTVNVGMTMGLLPVTGLPLPLLSYGGSSLLATMCGIGLVLNAGMMRREN